MDLIANSMKAGQSVSQALGAVTENAAPPVSDEFRLAQREVELGASVEGALTNMVKRIGTEARLELEATLGAKVFLDLHVAVHDRWREDERFLGELERPLTE